ncbi:MAG: hypothetical protein EBS77_02015 [Gammaproteobacteria bacterium]|jgi:thioredoxin-related protein|nr:hypothetical protein [Gammaproteobacteria bacterium]
MRVPLLVLSLFSPWLFAASPLAVNPDFSEKREQPWFIMVTQAGCHFCERLESQVLQPLRASDAYTGQIQFAHVGIDQGISVTDFDGRRIAGRDFAARYAAFGTPTLLFLSPDGESLADPKYGVPDAIDFYSYQIESVLQTIAPRK